MRNALTDRMVIQLATFGVEAMMDEFKVKDSGERKEYASGMVRDTQEGKPNWALVYDGPMLKRYAEHLTKGAIKYGERNWQKANSREEMNRFRASAARHFAQWINGERDEDHMAAVIFNLNAYEYVRARVDNPPPGTFIPVSGDPSKER